MGSAFDDIGQNYVDGTLEGHIVQLHASMGHSSIRVRFKVVYPDVENLVDELPRNSPTAASS